MIPQVLPLLILLFSPPAGIEETPPVPTTATEPSALSIAEVSPSSSISVAPSAQYDARDCQKIMDYESSLGPRAPVLRSKCGVVARVHEYCESPLTVRETAPSPAEVAATRRRLAAGTSGQDLEDLCPDPSDIAKEFTAPTKGLVSDGVPFQDLVLRGLSKFVSSRLEAELSLSLQERVTAELCADGTAGPVLLSRTCTILGASREKNSPPAWGVVKAAVERDLRDAPRKILSTPEFERLVDDEGKTALSRLLNLLDAVELGEDPQKVAIRWTTLAEDDASEVTKIFVQAGYLMASVGKTAEEATGATGEREVSFVVRRFVESIGRTDVLEDELKLKRIRVGTSRAIVALQAIQEAKELLSALPASDPVYDEEYAAYAGAIFEGVTAVTAVAALVSPDLTASTEKVREASEVLSSISESVRTRNYAELVLAVLEYGTKHGTLPDWYVRWLPFVAEVASAKDPDALQATLESAAEPVGGYRGKRGAKNKFTFSLAALAGVQGGLETIVAGPASSDTAGHLGFFAPIGVDLQWGFGKHMSGGVFFSLIDLGALVDFRQSSGPSTPGTDEVRINSQAEVGFGQVVSPGVHAVLGLGNSPLTLGLGAAVSPRLRSVEVGRGNGVVESSQDSTLRLMMSFSVDITMLKIIRR